MISASDLVRHYRDIHRERMSGLPICNERLAVEAVGFRTFDVHRIGVLITPWFINLVLLPGDASWSQSPAGMPVEVALPSGAVEFTLCCDDRFGVYMSAVLFRAVADFPDQDLARAVAQEILDRVFDETDRPDPPVAGKRTVSRRDLLAGLRPA